VRTTIFRRGKRARTTDVGANVSEQDLAMRSSAGYGSTAPQLRTAPPPPVVTMSAVDAMTGAQFERYIAGLLREQGWRDVEVVGGSGDGGADILAESPSGVRTAFQCKRQADNVGVQVVRLLVGSVHYEHAGRAPYLVTTAGLTKDAAALAAGAGVRLIDRPALSRWVAGVPPVSLEARPLGVTWRELHGDDHEVTPRHLFVVGPSETERAAQAAMGRVRRQCPRGDAEEERDGPALGVTWSQLHPDDH
jgi:Restriction endonuclease